MRMFFIILSILGVASAFGGLNALSAQKKKKTESRIVFLQQKILEKIPNIKHTRPALGTTEERPRRALEHATAIVQAADKYALKWQQFTKEAEWTAFNPKNDLPALIAAITYRESAFQSIVRLDDNTRVRTIPAKLASGTGSSTTRIDAGVMQVRVPSAPGRKCGVDSTQDIKRLISELSFAYDVGTCVLTNRLSHYVPKYSNSKERRMHWGLRPPMDLQYFGVFGPRKDTAITEVLKELVVIERYNWGNADLYLNTRSAGYARRVLTLFEYFRKT